MGRYQTQVGGLSEEILAWYGTRGDRHLSAEEQGHQAKGRLRVEWLGIYSYAPRALAPIDYPSHEIARNQFMTPLLKRASYLMMKTPKGILSAICRIMRLI